MRLGVLLSCIIASKDKIFIRKINGFRQTIELFCGFYSTIKPRDCCLVPRNLSILSTARLQQSSDLLYTQCLHFDSEDPVRVYMAIFVKNCVFG